MNQRTIDLDAFINLLDGQLDEGKNDTFYLDKSGIRAIVPDVAEREALGLLPEERQAIREHERDCRLAFPCTLNEALAWIKRIGGFELPDGMVASEEAPQADSKPGRKASIPQGAIDRYDALIAEGATVFAAELVAMVIFDLDGITNGSIRKASERRRRRTKDK
jgi:hypothetical protein